MKSFLTKSIPSKFLVLIGFFIALIVIFAFPNIAKAAEAGGLEDSLRLFKNMDIWFMLMLVAFLMIFIRKFEWGVCLAVLLTAISSVITYLFMAQYVKGLTPEELWTQNGMISAVVCAITVVIAIGVFLGTVKMWQYILAGILFTPAFVLLEFILMTWLPEITGGLVEDPGGGILVHQFAAYWGLGVALGIRERRVLNDPMHTTKHSITFVWLSAMLLFIFWPSFVTALLPLEVNTQVMINCYMSGFGSILFAYIAGSLLSKKKKINPLVYTYAMLAGPVASSSTLLLASPWASFLIGAVAGVISTICFLYLNAWLCNKLKILDVMGVHNLHGICGWISLLTGAMFAGSIVNIWAGLLTFALGIVAGLITGLIIRATRGKMEKMLSDEDVFEGSNPHPLYDPTEEQMEKVQ